MKNILVTGGAGYIGSHTAVDLIESGYNVVVADALYNARPDVVERIGRVTGATPAFYQIDLTDSGAVGNLFRQESF